MAGTIREIAEIAGVSRGTVDRALNKRGRINPEVAERILKIADEMGYVPKRVKKAAKKQPVKIGIVTQLTNKSFMIPIKKGIEDAALVAGQTGVDIETATQALKDTKGDLAAAILKLRQK